MQRTLVRVVACCCIALVMSACMSFPPIRDSDGRAVKLPWSDLAQINRLVAGRQDIRRPIDRIRMLSADRAEVSSGRTERTGDPETVFTIRKRNGRWFIEEGSVRQTTVAITS